MTKILGIIAGLIIFSIWMNVVGNPHVVETVLGMVVSVVCGYIVFRETRKLAEKFNKP